MRISGSPSIFGAAFLVCRFCSGNPHARVFVVLLFGLLEADNVRRSFSCVTNLEISLFLCNTHAHYYILPFLPNFPMVSRIGGMYVIVLHHRICMEAWKIEAQCRSLVLEEKWFWGHYIFNTKVYVQNCPTHFLRRCYLYTSQNACRCNCLTKIKYTTIIHFT